jgi:hypothetical protein
MILRCGAKADRKIELARDKKPRPGRGLKANQLVLCRGWCVCRIISPAK